MCGEKIGGCSCVDEVSKGDGMMRGSGVEDFGNFDGWWRQRMLMGSECVDLGYLRFATATSV